MGNIKIVNYSSKYQQELEKLVLEVKVKELGWEKPYPDLLNVKKTYRAGNGNFWLAIANKKVVGCVGLQEMGGSKGEIRRMYLEKSYRGTGLSKKMIDCLTGYAKAKNFAVLYLATSKPAYAAMKFYKKVGFKRIAALPDEFNLSGDTVFMKLQLT